MTQAVPDSTPKRKLEAAISEYVRDTRGNDWAVGDYTLALVARDLTNLDQFDYVVESRGLPHSLSGFAGVIMGHVDELMSDDEDDVHGVD